MDVERTKPRNPEYGGRHDQTIRGNNQRVRPRSRDPCDYIGFAQTARLEDGQASRLGEALDGPGTGTQAATRGSVGLRQNQRNDVAGVDQRVKRARGEIRCAGEDELQEGGARR